MAKRVARKIKRAGKVANQFSFTSTFEYIDLECKGSWRPDNLKVIWLRNHRRAQSINVEWICTDDRGPNGASGRAVFDPPISATLIVTLYKDSKQSKRFEEKEYKYYIENEGSSGKKILASFTCDMAEYAEVPSSRHALEMNFKPISTKVRKCHLGVTLESRFTKEGNPNDDDMQSTFSADVGGEDNKLVFADEDEEEIDEDDLDEAATLGHKVISNMTTDQKLEPDSTATDDTADNTSTSRDETTNFDVTASTSEPPPPMDSTTTSNTPDTETATTQASTQDTTTTDTTATTGTEIIEVTKEAIDEVESWLSGIELVDHGDKPVDISRLASADIIAFYFSASWCPPCKTFLPNLKRFYNGLKENNKSFELVYVSSDYSREEMVAYMSESTMPWTAIRYGHKIADSLRQDYSIRVIPILVIASRSGTLIDENAKKQVDKAASGMSPAAACIQLYNKWVEKIKNPEESVINTEEPKQKKATIKKQLTKDSDKSSSITNEELREATESKTPKSLINTGGNKDELVRQLQEKENIIRQLEEVNLSLKHTNDDLNTEMRNLKSRIELLNEELKSLKETDEKQKKDEEMFQEYLKLQGWLFKRGIKGPTANKWRRRYFRLDQGSKLYYYKNHTEGTPQGHIDLLKIIEVKELTASQQDKNNASFNIVCEGRTFQLQAYDEVEMRRWITAIGKVKEFYLKQKSDE